MPDTKITALTAIVTVDPVADVLPIVDVSDTSMAASGTTKKITTNQILGAGGTATLGTLNVTGATTLTGALTANGAVNLGDAVGDAVTVNGSLTAYTGQVPSAIRAAASDYAAVVFDGATAGTRITSALTGHTIGTGDFSVWCRFLCPSLPASGTFGLWILSPNLTTGGPNAFGVRFSGTSLIVTARDAVGTGTNKSATISGFGAVYAGQIVDIVVTRTGSTFKIYINGIDTAYTDGGAGSWADTVTATYAHVGMFDSSDLFAVTVHRFAVFNRTLSASDVVDLVVDGVNPADMWGAATAAYTSNFTATADSWVQNMGNVALTTTGNIDGVSGVNDTLRVTNTSGAALAMQVRRDSTIVAAKRYRVTFDYFAETGSGMAFLGLGFATLKLNTNDNIAVVENSWQTGRLFEFTANQTSFFMFVANTATGTSSGIIAAGKNLYLKNVVLQRIGAIVDLDFTVGAGFQAIDRSTNNLHGTLINGVEFVVPSRVAVLYATTNTSGNQQMLGSTALPTNAIIEDIIVNSTGSATVSVGNVSAGTQIVNGASVVSGRQRLTIATPFTTTGNLWVNSSSTATLQFTILYTIAA